MSTQLHVNVQSTLTGYYAAIKDATADQNAYEETTRHMRHLEALVTGDGCLPSVGVSRLTPLYGRPGNPIPGDPTATGYAVFEATAKGILREIDRLRLRAAKYETRASDLFAKWFPVTKALGRLTPETRDLLERRYRDDQTLREIGAELYADASTIGRRIDAAHDAFAVALGLAPWVTPRRKRPHIRVEVFA